MGSFSNRMGACVRECKKCEYGMCMYLPYVGPHEQAHTNANTAAWCCRSVWGRSSAGYVTVTRNSRYRARDREAAGPLAPACPLAAANRRVIKGE